MCYCVFHILVIVFIFNMDIYVTVQFDQKFFLNPLTIEITQLGVTKGLKNQYNFLKVCQLKSLEAGDLSFQT